MIVLCDECEATGLIFNIFGEEVTCTNCFGKTYLEIKNNKKRNPSAVEYITLTLNENLGTISVESSLEKNK